MLFSNEALHYSAQKLFARAYGGDRRDKKTTLYISVLLQRSLLLSLTQEALSLHSSLSYNFSSHQARFFVNTTHY
jgi:hypothetical protein